MYLALQATGSMDVSLRLQRFAIEDSLVGSINPDMRFLARSFDIDKSLSGQSVTSAVDGVPGKQHAGSTPAGEAQSVSSRRPSMQTERSSAVAGGSDDDDMQSACSEFESGQLGSQPSSAPGVAKATVVPLAEMVRPIWQCFCARRCLRE